jgi:DNA-binding transcriptional LysR family regulator
LLERSLGTPLVRRTRQGVHPTEAGRLLVAHADAILDRIALAEAQVAELAGLRSGRVRLGSFFTALVYLSAEGTAVLQEFHPGLVIEDELVDRHTAFRRLAAGALDVALVFEHRFEPDGAPAGVELIDLFDDPPRILLPAGHPLARDRTVRLADLAAETWVRAHEGSAARLVEHVLRGAGLRPSLRLAGHGDEPVEAQALVAAGTAVTLAHDLNVIIDAEAIAVRPLSDRDSAPARRVQAAIMHGQGAPAPLALLDALREVGRRRAERNRQDGG